MRKIACPLCFTNRSRFLTSSSEIMPAILPLRRTPRPAQHPVRTHLFLQLPPDPDARRPCRPPFAPPGQSLCQPAPAKSNLSSRPQSTRHSHSKPIPAPPRLIRSYLAVDRPAFVTVLAPDCPRDAPAPSRPSLPLSSRRRWRLTTRPTSFAPNPVPAPAA